MATVMRSLEDVEVIQMQQKKFFNSASFKLRECTEEPVTLPFQEINEIFLESDSEVSFEKQLQDVAIRFSSMLTAAKGRVITLISGDGSGKLSIGFSDYQETVCKNTLLSSIPSVTFNHKDSVIPTYNHVGAISCMPTFDEENENSVSWLSLFLRANYMKRFSVCMVSQKMDDSEILVALEKEYAKWFPKQKIQKSISESESTQVQKGENISRGGNAVVISKNESTNESTTRGTDYSTDESIEYASYLVEQYCELLKYHMDRQHLAKSIGLFQNVIYVSADEESVLQNAVGALSAATMIGKHGQPVTLYQQENLKRYMESATIPYEVDTFSYLKGYCSPISNVLHSKELSVLYRLPSQSYDGYEIKVVNDFEVSVQCSDEKNKAWKLGSLFQRNQITNKEVYIPYANIRQHCLISGITGSGKTNTIMSLLQNSPVPFLIIEPSKQEYRHLKSLIPNIKVFTPGNEQLSPIRLNPFYFPNGISVMSHIDSLKAVFMSAFSMYASMPNILEQCLYAVYQKMGWDLNTSKNIYATDGLLLEHYPTLELLYEEIDEYLSKSGYAEEQKSNIRAALLTRLKSLMTGSKGKLLNTIETFNFADLLKYPTVIELEEIADEDDKALIIGLFFIRLSEQLKVSSKEVIDAELQHFTVIEEAHRLFKNHSESQNPEIANTKGKAVEYFCNLLSEIRSRGEGIIIVDQVPTKLAPDALKNTDTKIIHRLVSQDDAEYVAQSLAISKENDLLFLSQLKRGEVLFFTSGMYNAAYVKVDSIKEKVKFTSLEELQENAKEYNAFIQNDVLVHPIADHILSQDSVLEKQLINHFRRFYFNILYGETLEFNQVLEKNKAHVLKIVEKFGYTIPSMQQSTFVSVLLLGILKKYLKEKTYFKGYRGTCEEVNYCFTRLLENIDCKWSKKELMQFDVQRSTRIYPQLIIAAERKLFAEPANMWMQTKRNVVDGDVVLLSAYLIESGIFKLIDLEKEPIENARALYEECKSSIQNQFLNWSWNAVTQQLVYRTLIQLTNGYDENLHKQFAYWIEEELI
ncbi:ATP-binding protein [Bacillus cereus]|nr:ATP-binding protein [Bacillus cereus]